jgi:hypothetical protein
MNATSTNSEFSITRGGLLDRLHTFLGVSGTGKNSTLRKLLFYASVMWIPLLALSAFKGLLWGNTVEMPFLKDFATHIRFLIVIPLFAVAEVVVDRQVKRSMAQFGRSGLLTEDATVKFEQAKLKADRMSESYLAEVIILALITAIVVLRISSNSIGLTTWMFPESDNPSALSFAGYWAAFISFPVFQFLLFRWLWSWLIWLSLLNRVSKVGLRIIPQHPDKSGGLGFLGESPLPFGIFTTALSIHFSAILAEHVLFQGVNLKEYIPLIIAFSLLCVLINVMPLLTFIKLLREARKRGINDYHALIAEHHLRFNDKWIAHRTENDSELLGHPDISSSTDIQVIYESVKNMTIFPFNIKTMLSALLISLLPLLLVFALQYPVLDILKSLAGILF